VRLRAIAVWILLLPAGAHAQEGMTPVAEPAAEPREQPMAPESLPPKRPSVEPPLTTPPAPLTQPLPPVTAVPPATPAPAQTPSVPQHLGLFAHADTGVAYLRTSGSRSGSTFAGEGAALGAGVAFGWAPNDEWALAVELWTWKALSASGLGPNTSVELQALGVSVTRYIVPANVFASVVVSGTRLAITDYGDYVEYASSNIGYGMKALLGKEWLLSPYLGIGIAAEMFFSVNKDGGTTLRTLGGGLVFSLTVR
jgi:hypothetical protein